MQHQKLKACVDSGRMQLSFWDKIQHYWIVILFSGLALMGLYYIIFAEYAAHHERGLDILLYCSVVALVFYFIQYRRLRFVILDTTLSRDEIMQVIQRAAKKRKWLKATQGRNYYTATSRGNFLEGSWGEQVTVIMHQKNIYINSICDLNKKHAVTAWGRNKKNVDVFKLELRKAENLKIQTAYD